MKILLLLIAMIMSILATENTKILCSYTGGDTTEKGFFRDTIVDKSYYPITIQATGKENTQLKITINKEVVEVKNPAIFITANNTEFTYYSPIKRTTYYLMTRDYYDSEHNKIKVFAEKLRVYKNSKSIKESITYTCGDTNSVLYTH